MELTTMDELSQRLLVRPFVAFRASIVEGELDIRPVDPHILREADRMTNRLFSGRFTWFWRRWYGVRGL